MRDLIKALVVVVSCCLAMSAIFATAYACRKPRLTSQEINEAARMAVNSAVEEAIRIGGLQDGEGYVRGKLESILSSRFHFKALASILRRNDFDATAVFYFDIEVEEVRARFYLEGVKDPLLSMRLGLDWVWREDPHQPYRTHGSSTVMSDCLTNHYFHMSEDGPDFFARLENRTEDPYFYGVETFIVQGGKVTVDHMLLGGKSPMDGDHTEKYGLG